MSSEGSELGSTGGFEILAAAMMTDLGSGLENGSSRPSMDESPGLMQLKHCFGRMCADDSISRRG